MVGARTQSLTARVREVLFASDQDVSVREARERRVLQHGWGVAHCERCGQTLVLSEPSARVRRDGQMVRLCPECLEPAPATPTWIAAPARAGRVPVRLGEPRTGLRRVA
jgi:hypothetical protein